MHTVLVAYRNEVFARGVMSFLEDAHEIEVVCVTNDGVSVLENARSLRPDVIIWERGTQEQDNHLNAVLQDPAARRVVTLSLESVTATVHEARHLQMAGPSWLVSLIRGDTKFEANAVN